MNRETLVKAMTELTIIFPTRTLSDKLIDVYFKALQVIPEPTFSKVLDVITSKSKFFPTIADFLEAYQATPKRRTAFTECVFCDSNGLVWLKNMDTRVETYFLCPKDCKNSQHFNLTVSPIPKHGPWKSRATLAKEWCLANPNHANVKRIEVFIANVKNLSYEEAQEKTLEGLVKFGQAPQAMLDKRKPWSYNNK